MRENRLAKLAGLKKLAQSGGSPRPRVTERLEYESGFGGTSEKDPSNKGEGLDPEKKISYINEILKDLFSKDLYFGVGGDFGDISPEDQGEIKTFVLQQITKRTLDENNFYEKIKEKFTEKGVRAPNKKEVDQYFYKLKKIQDLPEAVAASATPTKNKSSTKAPAAKPEATTGYTALTAEPDTKLEEVGTDKKSYVYTIISPSSFSYTVGGSAPKTVTTSYGKWNDAAQKLNTLEADRENKAAVAAATPATTTTETPAPSSNQELEDKITRILLLAQSKPLNVGSFESEMKQITEMSNYLSPKGGLRALSRIIASIVGPNLGQLNAASLAEVAAATPADARVNKGGKFAVDTRIILKQINLLYLKRRGVLDSYFKPAAPATPPTTTPETPAASADDGHSKDASLNKKFIKAATLRRLKIRSQMEAAIDSSAQMGRARVS